MDVTIIGTGNMGRGISRRLATGGHRLTLFDIDMNSAERLATELREICPGADVRTALLDDQVVDQIVILALKYAVAREVAERFRAELAGRIVVEISNPLNAEADALVTDPGTSAAEEIARLLPEARVVKAFNTTFAGPLLRGEVNGQPLDVLIAGDDEAAKTSVLALVRSGSMRGIDVGRLERAKQLEGLGLLGYVVQGPLGLGFMSSWKLIR
jgi:NADPH-dependent F420 reductase